MTALSPRHRQIVELVGRDGKSYPEIGRRLHISKHTVKTHVRLIVKRIGFDLPPRGAMTRYYWTEMQGR